MTRAGWLTARLVAVSWTWSWPLASPREVDWPQTLAELAQRWRADRQRRGRHRRRRGRRTAAPTAKEEPP